MWVIDRAYALIWECDARRIHTRRVVETTLVILAAMEMEMKILVELLKIVMREMVMTSHELRKVMTKVITTTRTSIKLK